MGKFIDLTGQKFGRLTVLKMLGIDIGKSRRAIWLCQCECGNQITVLSTHLKRGNTKSCGCLLKETARELSLTHGLSRSRLYRIWRNMQDRCSNVKNNRFKYYGGKGIKVCKEWLDDFINFYNWAIENGYQDDLSIDRINVKGNYEPNNCRWATAKEQANNRSNNKGDKK